MSLWESQYLVLFLQGVSFPWEMMMNKQTDVFEQGYKKFTNFVDTYRLFPRDRKRIVVAYSGGKDASLLCDFLDEYRNTVRPDIVIELVTVAFPRFIYDSPDELRKMRVENATNHWLKRGFLHTRIEAGPEFPDSILNEENPCRQCGMVIKPTLLGRQISKNEYRDAVYCVGLTLDDIIGWFIELTLLAAGRGNWKDVKNKDPDLFSVMMYFATRVNCKLEVKRNNLLYSRPLMDFSDKEIRTIVAQRKLLLIPEDCREITGRDAFADSPRRELGVALAAMRNKYPVNSPPGEDAIFSDYRRASAYFEKSGLLPSREEREKFVSDSFR